jgi:putative heme iron utilization protein
MEIRTDSNIVVITGNIKSVSDFQSIKQTLDPIIINNKNIILDIKDSLSITSSVIGYFNKLVLKDGVSIQMKVANPQLIELLDDLGLSSTFNITKV